MKYLDGSFQIKNQKVPVQYPQYDTLQEAISNLGEEEILTLINSSVKARIRSLAYVRIVGREVKVVKRKEIT
jgi:hypothetical protein